MTLFDIILYFIVGSLSGTMSGMLGAGGGTVLVPGFSFAFHSLHFPEAEIMHFAIGCSLSVIVLSALSATLAHHKNRCVNWSWFWQLLPGMCVGVIIGSLLASHLHSHNLQIMFGCLLIALSFRMLLPERKSIEQSKRKNNKFVVVFGSFITGIVSGLTGISGGVLLVPLLCYFGESMRTAAATSMSTVLPIVFIGSMSYMVTGLHQAVHVPYSLGYLYWPAIASAATGSFIFANIGARCISKVNVVWLKRAFAVILFIVAMHLLIS